MILSIECGVDSDAPMDGDIQWRVNQYLLNLYADENLFFNKITIECEFPDFNNYIPKIVLKENKIDVIEFPADNFYSEQLEILQFLESFSALDVSVRKIRWENPYIRWIAENDQERIAISGYQRKTSYPKNDRKLSSSWLQSTLRHRNMLKHLTEPLSFYRMGANQYEAHSYIQAFLNFYLMLEGCFGNGSFNKDKSIEAFMGADILTASISDVVENFNQTPDQLLSIWFKEYIIMHPEVNRNPIRKLVNIFVNERGKLAHYSANSQRRRNNFEDDRYQPLASVCRMVCHFATVKLKMEPFRLKP